MGTVDAVSAVIAAFGIVVLSAVLILWLFVDSFHRQNLRTEPHATARPMRHSAPPRGHYSPRLRPDNGRVGTAARVSIAGGIGFTDLPYDRIVKLGEQRALWWDVLGVRPAATRTEVINAYRVLAKVHHPDTGGDPAQFRRLRVAYENAIATFGAG
jgi:hypothetical protein